jgi:selenophosphate synthase
LNKAAEGTAKNNAMIKQPQQKVVKDKPLDSQSSSKTSTPLLSQGSKDKVDLLRKAFTSNKDS